MKSMTSVIALAAAAAIVGGAQAQLDPSYPNGFEVRLTDSDGSVSPDCYGRVEVRRPGDSTWGTMCDDGVSPSYLNHGPDTSLAICKSIAGCDASALGGTQTPSTQSVVGGQQSSLPIQLDNVLCLGTETHVAYCPTQPWGSHNCGHHEDLWVQCLDAGGAALTQAGPNGLAGGNPTPTCGDDEYVSGSTCAQCGPGSIPNANGDGCDDCAPGQVESSPGVCTACDAGTVPNAAASACDDCAAGSYAASGDATCTPCAAGTFAANPGQEACDACPSGQFSSEGAAACPCGNDADQAADALNPKADVAADEVLRVPTIELQPDTATGDIAATVRVDRLQLAGGTTPRTLRTICAQCAGDASIDLATADGERCSGSHDHFERGEQSFLPRDWLAATTPAETPAWYALHQDGTTDVCLDVYLETLERAEVARCPTTPETVVPAECEAESVAVTFQVRTTEPNGIELTTDSTATMVFETCQLTDLPEGAPGAEFVATVLSPPGREADVTCGPAQVSFSACEGTFVVDRACTVNHPALAVAASSSDTGDGAATADHFDDPAPVVTILAPAGDAAAADGTHLREFVIRLTGTYLSASSGAQLITADGTWTSSVEVVCDENRDASIPCAQGFTLGQSLTASSATVICPAAAEAQFSTHTAEIPAGVAVQASFDGTTSDLADGDDLVLPESTLTVPIALRSRFDSSADVGEVGDAFVSVSLVPDVDAFDAAGAQPSEVSLRADGADTAEGTAASLATRAGTAAAPFEVEFTLVSSIVESLLPDGAIDADTGDALFEAGFSLRLTTYVSLADALSATGARRSRALRELQAEGDDAGSATVEISMPSPLTRDAEASEASRASTTSAKSAGGVGSVAVIAGVAVAAVATVVAVALVLRASSRKAPSATAKVAPTTSVVPTEAAPATTAAAAEPAAPARV